MVVAMAEKERKGYCRPGGLSETKYIVDPERLYSVCRGERMIGRFLLHGAANFSCHMFIDPRVKVGNSRFEPKMAGRLISSWAGDSRLEIIGHVGTGSGFWQKHAKFPLCLILSAQTLGFLI